MGILKHKVYDFYRRKLQIATVPLFPDFDVAATDNAHYRVVEREMQVHLDEQVKLLPDQCRKVFLLRREEQLSNNEVAERLGISVNTVEQHMRKAIRILKGKLDYHWVWWVMLLEFGMLN